VYIIVGLLETAVERSVKTQKEYAIARNSVFSSEVECELEVTLN
jgi:hypothetical protein